MNQDFILPKIYKLDNILEALIRNLRKIQKNINNLNNSIGFIRNNFSELINNSNFIIENFVNSISNVIQQIDNIEIDININDIIEFLDDLIINYKNTILLTFNKIESMLNNKYNENFLISININKEIQNINAMPIRMSFKRYQINRLSDDFLKNQKIKDDLDQIKEILYDFKFILDSIPKLFLFFKENYVMNIENIEYDSLDDLDSE